MCWNDWLLKYPPQDLWFQQRQLRRLQSTDWRWWYLCYLATFAGGAAQITSAPEQPPSKHLPHHGRRKGMYIIPRCTYQQKKQQFMYLHQSIANPPTQRGTYPSAHTTTTRPSLSCWGAWRIRHTIFVTHNSESSLERHHLETVFQANCFPARLVKKTLSAPPKVPLPTQPPQKTLCTP